MRVDVATPRTAAEQVGRPGGGGALTTDSDRACPEQEHAYCGSGEDYCQRQYAQRQQTPPFANSSAWVTKPLSIPPPSSPWWKSRGSRCERRDDECETAGGRRCCSIGDERQRSRWRRAAATRWARGGYGRRLCHSSGPMARIATAPRFAPDTRKTLSRDPRDFHHGLLEEEIFRRGCGH